MKELITSFVQDESGATMVEYAVLVAMIAAAVITTIVILRDEINNAFQRIIDELQETDGGGA